MPPGKSATLFRKFLVTCQTIPPEALELMKGNPNRPLTRAMFNQFTKSIGSPNGRMILILSLLLTSGHGLAQETSATIPLQGTWRFSMDRADTGETNGWFRRDLTGSRVCSR